MPLWLDLLRTPMAAPEAASLRRLRRIWQFLCFALALFVGLFGRIHASLGKVAPIAAAILLLATGAQTWAYLRRKNAADNAFLARAGEVD